MKVFFLVLVVFAGLSWACRPEKPAINVAESSAVMGTYEETESPVVAKIGDREVTYDEVRNRLEDLPVFVRMRHQSAERSLEFLESFVIFEVLAMAAQEEGFATNPAVIDDVRRDLVDRYLRSKSDLEVKSTDIPDEAVTVYYANNPWEFNRPRQLAVRQLLVKDRALADRLEYRIRKVIDRTNDSPDDEFVAVVKQYTEDPSGKENGGDIGLFPRVGPDQLPVPEVVAREAERLSYPFESSAVVESDQGWHILFAQRMVEPISMTLDQARPRIVDTLMEQRRMELQQKYVDNLLAVHKVSIDEQTFLDAVKRVEANTKEKDDK